MSDLLHSVWQDLVEKRMWPVALGLLVALVAVPVFLLKGSDGSDGGSAPTAAAPSGVDIPTASLAETSSSSNSDLGVFDPKDPFRPAGGYSSPDSVGGSGGGLGVGTTVTGAGGGSTGGAASASGGSGSEGTGGSSDSGSPSTRSEGRRTTSRTEYEYVIDLRVGVRGDTRNRKGVESMTLLPSRKNPLFVFLGVSENHKSAVFLVHKGLAGQHGEGECKPSGQHCSFLYLQPGDESDQHVFTTRDGKEYVLHLGKIRRKVLKKTSKTTKLRAVAKRARKIARLSAFRRLR